MKEAEKMQIGFKFKMIKTLKFSVNNTDEAYKAKKEELQFNISAANFLDVENSVIGFDITIGVFIDKELTKQIADLIVRTEYELTKLSEIIKHDTNKNRILLPDQLMMTLLSVALSSARGILAAKTEGSVLEGVYMPIIDPTKFRTNVPIENTIKDSNE
jgi:hypothetical protein